MHQRRPSGVMVPSVRPAACRICDTAPAVPDEPSASCQVRREQRQRLFQLGAGGHLGVAEARSVNWPSGKKRIDRLTLPTLNDSATRPAALAQDHLGAAPADVDHQPLGRPGCRNDTPA
jgi:hypothetical protein